jgi:hypothetical protein
MEAVQAIKEAHRANPVDAPGLTVNATITGVPFGEPTRELCSSHGPAMGWRHGRDPMARISMTLDYPLARALALDDTLEVLEQAIVGGSLVIEGDSGKLRRWWRSRIANPELAALEREIRAVTA